MRDGLMVALAIAITVAAVVGVVLWLNTLGFAGSFIAPLAGLVVLWILALAFHRLIEARRNR